MNKQIAEDWVAALRSGKYKQGTGRLRDGNDQFCCLGVLCDLLAPDSWEEENDRAGEWTMGYDSSLLPDHIRTASEMKTADGTIGDTIVPGLATCLVAINDEGRFGFNEIADIIEKRWEEL